jgi:cell division septum initiation protein DivIVA
MAEITVQFRSKLNGYDKKEVNQFVKDAEAKLQEKALALANLQQQVVELEARLTKIIGNDESVEEKIELYDKLMKKMDGDYTNLLAPAIAKAKAIEEKAQKEYEIRMDQARATADGIYVEAADRIAGVVDANMDRLYNLLDEFIYSKTLAGRISKFVKDCKAISQKVCETANNLKTVPSQAYTKVKTGVQSTYATAKAKVQAKIASYKDSLEALKAE